MEPYVSLIGEGIRNITPGSTACRLGCSCHCSREQENFVCNDESNVIAGLNSHWVEDGAILAMARPAEPYMRAVIQEFCAKNILTVINLQQHGEHEFCATLVGGAFTYKPETLMKANISYYNFPTDDFGVWPIDRLLDITKVVSFAVSEGGVAIHCHAGLGRTGVICACWLIFDRGLSAEEAIKQVRARRKGAIQTRQQLASVINFDDVLRQLRHWPDGQKTLKEIHRCYVKSYNKHEFGKHPDAPPLLLKIKHILKTRNAQSLTELNTEADTLDKVKNGYWNLLQFLSTDSFAELIRSWLGGLPEPLIVGDLVVDNLSLSTARVANDIMTQLKMNETEILKILSRSETIDKSIYKCLFK